MRWEEVRPEEKLPILNGSTSALRRPIPRIKKVSVGFADESGAILIADSNGRLVEDVQPMTSLYVSCVAEQGGKREQGGYNVAGRAGFELYTPERLDRLVREAVGRTTILFEAVPPPAGEMPVVLAAGSSGILLHEAIGHGMEADFNRKNVSIYADKIGKAIAKPFVNIVDDATNEGARGAINVDDEGNEAGRTMLVQDGVLTTYLHDTISAKHYGVAPTGNGRRESYQHAPMPRMRSTYMLPGPHQRDEIIASVKKGIYCSNFTNGQVQIGAGDFTFYVKNGYLIEDGKLTRPIKDVNIIGNGPKVLEKVDMVSDDLAIDEGGWTCGKDGQSVPVSQGMPTVRVASITVGGRGRRLRAMAPWQATTARGRSPHGAVALALAKGAGQAAVRAYRVRDVSVQWRDGKLEQINEATTRGVGLAALRGRPLRGGLDQRPAAGRARRVHRRFGGHDADPGEGPVPVPARAEALRGPGDGGPEARGSRLRDGHAGDAAAAGPRARGGGAGGAGQRRHHLRDHRVQRHARGKCCGSRPTASRGGASTRPSGPRPRSR